MKALFSHPSNRSRRPALLRFFMGLAFALALLAGLVLVLLTFESWRGNRKWNSLKTELEAQRETLSLKAIQPPAVPEDKNFAAHPLIAALFPTNRQPPEPQAHLLPKAALEDRTHDKSANGPGRKRNDFRTHLKLWSDYYRGHAKFPQAPENATPAEVVRTALAKYDPEINELIKAMQERPFCRYPLNYEQGLSLLLPHLAAYKSLTQVIQLRALADLHLGQPDKAFRELRLGCFINDTLAQDPILICLLVHIANDTMLWDAVRQGIGLHLWNEEQLAWWVDYLSKREYLKSYQTGMRGERNFAVHTIEQLSHGRIQEALGVETSPLGWWSLKAMPSGIYYHNLHHLVKMHHDYLIPVADPQKRTVDKDLALDFDLAVKKGGRSPYTIFSRLMMPGLRRPIIHVARWQTLGDATLLACAAERYRLATGAWPASLDELAPKYAPFIPRDVINGSPFHYQIITPDTLRIYTFGWDEIDNQGQTEARLEHGDWCIEIGPVDTTTRR